MVSNADGKCPVSFVGPFPPPQYGQSIATQNLANSLSALGMHLERIDISQAHWPRKLLQHLIAATKVLGGRGTCYISLNSNAGMWLSSLVALAARLRGRRIFLHHHAYDHVLRRSTRMVATALAAGPQATHIVLGPRMAEDLERSTPEVRKTFVLNNAGLVTGVKQSHRKTAPRTVLGHMSNLSAEKGIGIVVASAMAAWRSGHDVELRVAGPCTDAFAEAAIERAREELGRRFTYLGPVSGLEKEAFFEGIDVFLFPSQYKNEAEPLVLLESLATGAPCIATSLGCIRDDIGQTGGICVVDSSNFAEAVCDYLEKFSPNSVELRAHAVQRFRELLAQHREQIESLKKRMS